MDERKLEELFRDAARAAPEASFDEQDVMRGSRRVTARRRMTLAGGSLVAAAVLVTGVGYGSGLFTTPTDMASPPQSESKPVTPRGEGPGVLAEPSQSGCGSVDRRLAGDLTSALPKTPGSVSVTSGPLQANVDCPPGSDAAAVMVRDGGKPGRVSAVLSPASSVPAERVTGGVAQRPDGTKVTAVRVPSGKVLSLYSAPASGSHNAPLGTRLAPLARELGEGL